MGVAKLFNMRRRMLYAFEHTLCTGTPNPPKPVDLASCSEHRLVMRRGSMSIRLFLGFGMLTAGNCQEVNVSTRFGMTRTIRLITLPEELLHAPRLGRR
jgi:hypothetical protein